MRRSSWALVCKMSENEKRCFPNNWLINQDNKSTNSSTMTIISGCNPGNVTFWKRRFTKACPSPFANHLNVNNTSYITKTCVFHLISSRNLFQCHLQLKSDLSTMKNKENLPTSALLQFKMADKRGKTASELLCKRAHEAVCVCVYWSR